MDGDLFTEWVKELDRIFAAQDRKVALIVGNCPANPIVDGLKAIELNLSTTEQRNFKIAAYGSSCY